MLTVAPTPPICGLKNRAGDRRHHDEGGEAFDFGEVGAGCEAGNLGVVPLDREGDGGGAEDGEVVGVVGVLPDIVAADDEVLADGLLDSGVDFVAEAGVEGGGVAGAEGLEDGLDDTVGAACAGEDEIFVEGGLLGSGVGGADDGIGLFEVVGGSEAGFGLTLDGEAVVEVSSHADVQEEVAEGELVLRVEGELLDVGLAVIAVEAAAAGEVVGGEDGVEGGVGVGAERGVDASAGERIAAGVEAGGVERGVDEGDLIVFAQEGLLVHGSGLRVVDTLDVGEVGMDSGVEERALLGDRFLLDGAEVGEGIAAGEVAVGVAAEVGGEVEDGGVGDGAGVGGGEEVGFDLGALVGGTDGLTLDGIDDADVEGVVGVGGLEPGAGVLHVGVDGGLVGELGVDAVEEVDQVAFIVEDGELAGIEKATGVEAGEGGEVAEAGGSEGDVAGEVGCSEAAVGGGDRAGGLADPLSGAGGDLDDEAGFVAELGGWGSVDDFEGLDGVGGDLVGEDLGLLVGDGLAVEREGVFGVVAEAVEEAVRIRGDAGRGQGDEGGELGRGAFEGELIDHGAVDVGVEGGIVLHEVGACFDVNDGGRTGDGELEAEVEGDDGLDGRALGGGLEAGAGGGDAVGVEGEIVEVKDAGGVGFGGSGVAGDGVGDLDGGVGDDCSGGVGDGAGDGAGGSLGVGENGAQSEKEKEIAETGHEDS